MKHILLNFLVFLTLVVNAQELEFSGKLEGLDRNTKVILSDLRKPSELSGRRFHDTAMVTDGEFKFKVKLPGSGTYALRVGLIGKNPEHRTFYFDGGKVQLVGQRGQLDEASLSGDAPYLKDYLRFTEMVDGQEVFKRKKLLTDTAMMKMAQTGSYEGLFKDPSFADRLMKVDKEATDKTIEIAKQWIKDNPKSDINAYVIYTYLRNIIDDKSLAITLDTLSPGAKKSFPGLLLKSSLN